MAKEKDLSTIIKHYISHITEPRYIQYKVYPVGTKIQTEQGIKTVEKGDAVLIENGPNGKQCLCVEKAEDILNERGTAVYSKDGKLEQIIKNSAKEQLEKVDKKLKDNGVEFIRIEDTDKNFLGENIIVRLNGKIQEIDPNGIGYPKNDKGLAVKKVLLNTIEKYGNLKPEDINFEELSYSLDMNPYFLKAFLNAQKSQ